MKNSLRFVWRAHWQLIRPPHLRRMNPHQRSWNPRRFLFFCCFLGKWLSWNSHQVTDKLLDHRQSLWYWHSLMRFSHSLSSRNRRLSGEIRALESNDPFEANSPMLNASGVRPKWTRRGARKSEAQILSSSSDNFHMFSHRKVLVEIL